MAGQIQCGRRVRRDFGKISSIVEIPNLIEIQRNSYEAFLQKDYTPEHREDMGLQAVFKSVFPISDYNENASLEFVGYTFGDPKYTVEECHARGMTHAIPLKVTLRLVVYEQDKSAKHRAVKDIKEQEVYLGELPLMTEKGTFIINGTERVVVSQLQRSAGVFFDDDKGKTVASGKPLNARTIEKLVEAGVTKIPVKADSLVGRRTADRVVDADTGEVLVETNQEISQTLLTQLMARKTSPLKLLTVIPGKADASVYETLARDHFKNPDEALVEIYRRLRPGDPPTVDSARALFRGMFMDPRRYDLARVGRFMINKKLGINANLNIKTLRGEDVVAVIRHLLMVRLGTKPTDDIDHLGNRRVRSVGELLENQFRVGLTRMERAVKERMSISDITNLMPH